MNAQALASIWSMAELLGSDCNQSDYGKLRSGWSSGGSAQ